MTSPKSNEKSALPMPGLSKRAQQQLQPRRFGVYSRARPAEKK
jgi:hypothetical protein